MYARARRRMHLCTIFCIANLVICVQAAPSVNETSNPNKEVNYDNNIIESETEYDVEYNKKYGINPSWQIGDALNKNNHKYTVHNHGNKHAASNRTVNKVIKDSIQSISDKDDKSNKETSTENGETSTSVPENLLVVPISKITESNTNNTHSFIGTTKYPWIDETSHKTENSSSKYISNVTDTTEFSYTVNIRFENIDELKLKQTKTNTTDTDVIEITVKPTPAELDDPIVPVYTELDYEGDVEVPEDYYDAKDLVPTAAPNIDALSVIFGLAGNVAESVAERFLPKTIFDLYKRMQQQNQAIEAVKLRSREENGGLGQFGRGILKSISSGISRPLNQLMAGARDIGSLDSDRGFVSGVASSVVGVADGVANVANSLADAFKDRVQAIFPGTLWCGDGHSPTARSHELGLFFLTDTCCRQHDACKLFIRSGQTQYGLTNTGLFTRSHCSCDVNFRSCLKKTNSLVSSQIGLTYFNVLGPQCFRKAHPIVRCVRRTRITGQKCEEYEIDFSKPKMWQWFDSETF